MEVEIPFIPASQRPVKVEEQDTIVVVGQARQKRKRPKAGVSLDGADAASGSAGAKVKKTKVNNGIEVKDEDREAFDFSAIPNILDDNPNLGEGNNKKKREKKDKKGKRAFLFLSTHDTYRFLDLGGAFYGDFPAPPKAHSELKSGNQSHTFK
jgi:exosome complex exonuclease RRP6